MIRAKLAHDRWATLCALEVLKLIGDQMERRHYADPEDIQAVLRFFKEIAHSCLDNTEKRLLLPFLEFEIGALERSRLNVALESHRRLCGLLDELERCHRDGSLDEFVVAARTYTAAFGDFILEEQRFLPALIQPFSSHSQVQQLLAEYYQAEVALVAQARLTGGALRKLEAKYVSPHCI